MTQNHKPKVCYILPSYDPATGSHFFHIYEMLEAAAGALDIFLVIEKDNAAALISDRLLARRCYCQRFSWPPLRFIELLAVLMRERLRGRRYFYTHYSFYGALASWLVTMVLGGTAYYWNSGMPWLYRRSWFEEAVFRFILRRTALITHPPGLAEEYRRRYGLRADRIRIVPHYISVQRFLRVPGAGGQARRELGLPAEAKVILFVHRLSRRKGAHLIPEIAAQVTKQRKDVMFIIVGSGPERENLERGVRGQGLGDRVKIIGEVPQRDLPPYFWAADALLLPSEEEGFPHVLLEAMAARVPYVASDVGGVREITPPFLLGNLVASGDVKLFSEKIIALLDKPPEDIAAIGHQEQKWVKQYSIDQALADFTALFR